MIELKALGLFFLIIRSVTISNARMAIAIKIHTNSTSFLCYTVAQFHPTTATCQSSNTFPSIRIALLAAPVSSTPDGVNA